VRILSIVHQADAGAGVFAEAAAARDAELVEWTPAADQPPEGGFDRALVLGGSMHPDQDERHPWLHSERRLIEGLLEGGVPTLGVCLGAELVAEAAGGSVRRLDAPEFGWFDVTLTPAGQADPVLGALPGRFAGFQSHSYAFELPSDAQRLALGDGRLDAFRSGAARGIQFHPEVTPEIVERWLAKREADPTFDTDLVRAETAERIDSSTELGRRLFGAFLDAAEPDVVTHAAR
jgi:GMP synthase (glutamine-hydrolysing)